MSNIKILSTTFYKSWVHPDLKLPAEIPFKISFSAGFIPSVGIDLERLKKDLQIFWEKLKGGRFDINNVLTVQECVEKITHGELKENAEIAVAAFVPDFMPKRITQFPGFSSRDSSFLIAFEKNAGAYCPEVGREFFNGVTSNFMYLAETVEDRAFFIRAYFPAAEVPPEHLRMVNNRGVLIYGSLKNAELPYPSLRTAERSGNATIERFTGKIELGIMAQIMYVARATDTSNLLREYGLEENPEKFFTWADEKFQVFWLYQRT